MVNLASAASAQTKVKTRANMTMAFSKFFEPGKIGNLEIKNRIVMPPMGTHWAPENGYVIQKHIDYYAERAKGGVGLIIVEASCVQFPLGRAFEEISLDDDKYLPGLSRLAEAIKNNGARVAMQLHHAGANTNLQFTRGLTPVAPSAVNRRGYTPSRALTIAEIKEMVSCFVQAAWRCQKAGFDAVEVHGAHQYLLAEFLSPVWNQRKDEYGGSIENRARLLTNIVSSIKEKIANLPIICRFNGQEFGTQEFFGTPGLTLDDACETARLVEAKGADAVHISAFGWGRYGLKNLTMFPGELLPLAAAIKKAVSIPVIAVGRMLPEIGEQALREGKADFISIGRGLIADPYLPQKLLTGDVADIAPCITCYECLGPRRFTCSVNTRIGEEATYPYPIPKAVQTKKVVVIGGGPGGMEAARIAALRGHEVMLYEKEEELGGKLLVAGKASSKANIALLNPYLKRQIEKAGVKVKLGKLATVETVRRCNPDALIFAIGAQPVVPEIKGLERAKVIHVIDYLSGKADVGNKVLIIGGEMVGCEVAEVLAERGKEVTIVRRSLHVATKLPFPALRHYVIGRLIEKGVKFQLGASYKEVTPRGLTIVDREGNERILEADSIILASGAQSNNKLLFELKGGVPQIIVIGDALEPRRIIEAIHEGFKTAYSL